MNWINDIEPQIIEDNARNYGHRTWANAEWSDITLAFAVDFRSPGEITTKKAAGDKHIGFQLNADEVIDEFDNASLWEGKARRFATFIRQNPHYTEDGIKLNIAGNSMITLAAREIEEDQAEEVVYNVIKGLLAAGIKIDEIRSGGQTGIDEFGIKAAQRLGLICSILAPKGFRMHYREGEEIEGREPFVRRFCK